MLRFVLVAFAAAVTLCAPARAAVIQSGVAAGVFAGQQLAPGETQSYRLDLWGDAIGIRIAGYAYTLEYRGVPGGGLAISNIPFEYGCGRTDGGPCLDFLPASALPTSIYFTITGWPTFGKIEDCYNVTALGPPCHIAVTSTGFYINGRSDGVTNFSLSLVPEPATWAMMIGGFGMIGSAYRVRRRQTRLA